MGVPCEAFRRPMRNGVGTRKGSNLVGTSRQQTPQNSCRKESTSKCCLTTSMITFIVRPTLVVLLLFAYSINADNRMW
jgi:hypothetical protein